MARLQPALDDVALERSARAYRAFGALDLGAGQEGKGNPAAVAFCTGTEPVATLVSAARMIGLPMTAFVAPTTEEGHFGIRYFSANGTEFQLCGHATIAAVRHVADGTGLLAASFRIARPLGAFAEVSGVLAADGRSAEISLPKARLRDHDLGALAPELGAILELAPHALEHLAVSDLGDLLAVVCSPADLRAIRPDMGAAAALTEREGFRGILVTTRALVGGHDIENRAFFPAAGIDEDLACGSANSTVLPYWQQRLGADRLTLRILYPGGAAERSTRVGGSMVGSIDDRFSTIALVGAVSRADDVGPPG